MDFFLNKQETNDWSEHEARERRVNAGGSGSLALVLFVIVGLFGVLAGAMASAAPDASSTLEIKAAVLFGFGLVTAAVATTGLVLRKELRSLRKRMEG
jgi:hypothetical protein